MPLHLLGISRSKDVASLSCPSFHGQAQAVRLPSPASGEGQGVRGLCQPIASAGLPDSIEVRWVVQDSLAAATVGPVPTSFGPLEHARLLAAIHSHLSVLPARYGVGLPNEEAVQAFLSSRWRDLSSDLDRIEGTSEIGLRIELACSPAPAEPPVSSGAFRSDISPARYLALRQARYQWHDQVNAQAQLAATTCVRAIEGLYRTWRRLSPEPLGMVRLAFLVERRMSQAFAERLETWKADKAGQRYTVLGPWPPYSFVGVVSLAGNVQRGADVDARQSLVPCQIHIDGL